MKEKKDFGKFLKTLYFYLFSSIGLILVIIGVFQISDFAVRKYLLPKYNLGYEENRCDYLTQPAMPAKEEAAPTESDLKEQAKKCEEKLEEYRKYKEVTDFARGISFIVVGGIVFAFHFRQTRKQE
jgi:hypothetical protein